MLKAVATAVLVGGAALSAAADTVSVTKATYAGHSGKECNALAWVSTRCDGRASCQFIPGNEMCGDPDFGTPKTLSVEWKCGDDYHQGNATEGSRISLSCAGIDATVMSLTHKIDLPGAKRHRAGKIRIAIPSGYEVCRDEFADFSKSPRSTYEVAGKSDTEIIVAYECPCNGGVKLPDLIKKDDLGAAVGKYYEEVFPCGAGAGDAWMNVVYGVQVARRGRCPAGK